MFITFSDAYIVVSPSYIQFGVDMCVAQIADEVRNKGKWVLVTHSEGIDFAVILHWSELAILLSYEKEG